MHARDYTAREVTRDGVPFYIRAIRADDKGRLDALFHRLSPETVYNRFFELKRTLTPAELAYLTELDFERRAALVAALTPEPHAPLVGVARFETLSRERPDDPLRAELGVVVEDAHQNRGIGTQLLKHLLGIAYAAGVRRIVADVLPANTRILELIAASGFPVRQRVEGGVIHLSL